MNITDFLQARIDEDKEAAKRAAFGYGQAWTVEDPDPEDDWVCLYAGKQYLFGSEDVDIADHAARFDPARILRECAAKQRTLQRHGGYAGELDCSPCFYDDEAHCRALRELALPYYDHPDYDPAWAL